VPGRCRRFQYLDLVRSGPSVRGNSRNRTPDRRVPTVTERSRGNVVTRYECPHLEISHFPGVNPDSRTASAEVVRMEPGVDSPFCVVKDLAIPE